MIDDKKLRSATAAALVELPGMTPRRLGTLLLDGAPEIVWEGLISGRQSMLDVCFSGVDDPRALVASWRKRAKATDLEQVLVRYEAAGIEIRTRFDEFPARLQGDDSGPVVLFKKGDDAALDAPTVGVVGTRNCTREGYENAYRMSAELTEAGVAVVSGLARGIDGAAHRGALSVGNGAKPVGVVGNGLDIVYPRGHEGLWNDVAEKGLLLSESHLGARPEKWRFPARNRIIAGLSDLLLVVESNATGGSLITALDAARRGRDVFAIPGSIRSRASVGTNALIQDGAIPACSTQDLLDRFSLRVVPKVGNATPLPPVADREILDAVDRHPTSTDEILLRTTRPMGETVAALLRLEEGGWIAGIDGWWQRVTDDTARASG